MTRWSRIFLWSAIGLLAGCASIPDIPPSARERTADAAILPRTDAAAAWPGAGWWRGWGDSQLDALMVEALAGSPDVAMAAARVRQAEANAQESGAADRLSVTAEASGGVNKQSYNLGIPPDFVPKGFQDTGRLALSANLDLDLWGRNRAALAAATSEATAARVDADQAALTLTTAIADGYARLAMLYAERDVADAAIRVRSESGKLVADRAANGLENQGELRQAEADVPAARADRNQIDESIAQARNRLAFLVGATPDRGARIARPTLRMGPPARVPADVGIALIGRRPDLVARRLRAEAAASRIKVARAGFYPDVSLSALIGLQSLGFEKLLRTGSSIGSAGPALTLPIFDGGRLRARYRNAAAGYDAAVADYDSTLLSALQEVADAAAGLDVIDARITDQAAALKGAEGAYAIARQRYEGGLSARLGVLSAEDRLLSRRRLLVDAQARAMLLDVALVRALGGGYREGSR
ncbi:MAG TPA: efflux transporter outer membrane subunit [Sphingomonas sp.]|jgi:NodT family efflux transporter outer membrane factor (OMF) lipoprotein|uniref:efflux transporter outer membrane subunit n=1 Tax=Sphingomonas sp. TaxID=28214 RepID=UPI002ED7F4F6